MMADSLSFEPSRRERGEVDVTIFIEGQCHIITLEADTVRLAALQGIKAADASERRW